MDEFASGRLNFYETSLDGCKTNAIESFSNELMYREDIAHSDPPSPYERDEL